MAYSMPGVGETERYGNRSYTVGKKSFAWERAFSKADITRFGSSPVPSGPIVATIVDDLGEKEAVLAAGHKGFFTIPHFNGFPAVSIQLEVAGKRAVRDAIEDAWLACAPRAMVDEFLERSPALALQHAGQPAVYLVADDFDPGEVGGVVGDDRECSRIADCEHAHLGLG